MAFRADVSITNVVALYSYVFFYAMLSSFSLFEEYTDGLQYQFAWRIRHGIGMILTNHPEFHFLSIRTDIAISWNEACIYLFLFYSFSE